MIVVVECTCPWGVKPLGRLHGVNMGKGSVRLSTTKGCPVHDTCGVCGGSQHACYRRRWAKGFAKMLEPCCKKCTHLQRAARQQ